MAFVTLAIVGLAAAVVYLSDRFFSEEARRIFEYIRNARLLVVGTFVAISGLVMIGSGVTALQIAGFLIWTYLFAALFFEIDLRDVISGVIP